MPKAAEGEAVAYPFYLQYNKVINLFWMISEGNWDERYANERYH